eukprot:Opistho-2@66879
MDVSDDDRFFLSEDEEGAQEFQSPHSTRLASTDKAIVHLDIDAFYVAAERHRRPDLVGIPVAVSQHNRGGFVAVSYEAKAMGIRKGDGVGDKGREAIEHLRDRISLEDACGKCPGLVVLLMDMPFYRSVSEGMLAVVKRYAAVVEKTSIDDFYIDATDEALKLLEQSPTLFSSDNIKVYGPHAPSPLLVAASSVCSSVRQALFEEYGATSSASIAPSKIVARLASPTAKPNGQVIVPADAVEALVGSTLLEDVPYLGGRLAPALQSAFGASFLGELLCAPLSDLVRVCGQARGEWLHEAIRGRDACGVVPRGAPKSIMAEASFGPQKSAAALSARTSPLVTDLMLRLVVHWRKWRTMPRSLSVRWREGYRKMSAHSVPFPYAVLHWIRSVPQPVQAPPQPSSSSFAINDECCDDDARSGGDPIDNAELGEPLRHDQIHVPEAITNKGVDIVISAICRHLVASGGAGEARRAGEYTTDATLGPGITRLALVACAFGENAAGAGQLSIDSFAAVRADGAHTHGGLMQKQAIANGAATTDCNGIERAPRTTANGVAFEDARDGGFLCVDCGCAVFFETREEHTDLHIAQRFARRDGDIDLSVCAKRSVQSTVKAVPLSKPNSISKARKAKTAPLKSTLEAYFALKPR